MRVDCATDVPVDVLWAVLARIDGGPPRTEPVVAASLLLREVVSLVRTRNLVFCARLYSILPKPVTSLPALQGHRNVCGAFQPGVCA